MVDKISLETRLNHVSFPQPDDLQTPVWRYFDLPKFVWMLQQRELYFTRLDLLGDQFEGSSPRLQVEARRQSYPAKIIDREGDYLSETYMKVRRSYYVNCWRLGSDESEAMWRLYCPDACGIAIQTSYARLCSSIEDESAVYMGVVRYIDYEKETFRNTDNILEAVMHKRSSFAHESEVRLVIPFHGLADGKFGENNPSGISIPWKVTDHIQSIFVSPYAPKYFYDVVVKLVNQLAPTMENSIKWSEMRGMPFF